MDVIEKHLNFGGLKKHILYRLETELPTYLTYHDVVHTKGVLAAAQNLAAAEDVGKQDRLVLETAALLHDSGFLKTYKAHEEASCEIAREILLQYGCNSVFIERVCQLIMVTKLPQRPVDKLEQILCDADLHYLGTNKYIETADHLYEEFKKEGLIGSHKEWQQKQVSFLLAHRYFTNSAKELFGPSKEAHLKELMYAHHPRQHFSTSMQDVFFLILGVLIAGFGLKGFLVPNHFFAWL